MLFRSQPSGVLAISQLTHAWISGQIMRAWDEPLAEPLLLAIEQHDIGWLDWETAPSFNPETGRPHLFREIGASIHAPMWTKGIERALGAWGMHVALLISRHGGVIYRRYIDRHRVAAVDADAADRFLGSRAPIEAEWARATGLDAVTLKKQTTLLALADTLSLALCGELKAPLDLEAADRNGDRLAMRLTERPDRPFTFTLSPWPFRVDVVTVEGEARPLPAGGRFPDEAAMRAWFASSERVTFIAHLSRS
jgi:predicted small lipoprotein YifL